MTHDTESSFEDDVAAWFDARHDVLAVERQHYQPDPRWYVDLVVTYPWGTLFIELESRASEVRHGIAQAQGYAAAAPRDGIPMVVVPKGHLHDAKVDRLVRSSTTVVREFDDERGEFVR